VDLNFDPPFPKAPAFKAVSLAADAETHAALLSLVRQYLV
jgi:hypothetical protein